MSAGLELDHVEHRYTFNGARVAGVSEILTGLGIVDPRFFTPEGRDRGTAVHAAVEYLLQGRLDWDSLDSRIRPYVDAAARFFAEAGISVGQPLMAIERPLWHPTLRFAGTPDLVAVAWGVRSIIDFKSGGLGHVGLSTAAYELAVRLEEGQRLPLRRIAIQLKPDGTYKKTPLTDSRDYQLWSAAALLFNEFHLGKKDRDDGNPRSLFAA